MSSCKQTSEALSPWVSILFTLMLGVFGTIIASKQTKLSYHSVRLDLFDRRFRIFDETRKFIEYLIHDPIGKKPDIVKIGEFRLVILEAEFLFDSEVSSLLDKFQKSAFELEYFERVSFSKNHSEEECQIAQAKRLELIKWLLEQNKELSRVFMPYLHFSKTMIKSILQ